MGIGEIDRICEFCGCHTNAALRRCCEKGTAADKKGPSDIDRIAFNAAAKYFGEKSTTSLESIIRAAALEYGAIVREECAKPLLEISGAESVDEALDIFRREREANVGLATEAARWHTFCDYWAASAVLECTQDEEGTWSIRQIEPVECLLLPLTGDTPDAALDAAIKEGS